MPEVIAIMNKRGGKFLGKFQINGITNLLKSL